MVPLLATALIGLGVKIATDLLMSGAKQAIEPPTRGTSFSTMLDRMRGSSSIRDADGPAAVSAAPLPGAGLADRSRILAVEMNTGLPPAARTLGAAAYRRVEEAAP